MMPKAPDIRTPNNPWPEWPKICKTDYGQEEAIALFGSDPRIYTTTVKEFIGDKAGNLKKAVCCKLESKKDEKTGRMMMVPIEGSEFTLDVDVVLIAAGFLGSQDYVTKAFGVEVNARTNVNTAPGSIRPTWIVSSPPEICTGASLWLYGPSARAGRPPARWIWI